MTNEEEKIQIISALILVAVVVVSVSVYNWIVVDGDGDLKGIEISKQYTWIEKGKESIKERLKDPSSAQFKDVFFHHNKVYVPVACGHVNSKNSFGGYVGYQRFISAGRPEFTFLENEMKSTKEFNKTWHSLCYG